MSLWGMGVVRPQGALALQKGTRGPSERVGSWAAELPSC